MTDVDVAAVARGLSKAGYATIRKAPKVWATCSETGMTGMSATLLSIRQTPLLERRWTNWGSDKRGGIKGGEAYEYRLTPLGLAVRQHLLEQEAGRTRPGAGRECAA